VTMMVMTVMLTGLTVMIVPAVRLMVSCYLHVFPARTPLLVLTSAE
jgi:hypothetical protein